MGQINITEKREKGVRTIYWKCVARRRSAGLHHSGKLF
jgi:hypothetical protein